MTRALVTLFALAVLAAPPLAADETGWFVLLPSVPVPPIPKSDTQRLLDGGVIETDGFAQMTFSFGGEFKDGVPTSGRVGAILVPDDPRVLQLLQREGQVVFAVEVTHKVTGGKNPIFVSEQQTQRVAFPRYRVFFYNETGSTAVVSLSVYRSRC
ncbi:MAG TPA: hypothetical protein VF139_05925 [Candidatus Polarisedimenticolaceae bacterium]